MNHRIFRYIQLVTKWLFVSLPNGTIFGNQTVLLSVIVVKINIDCNNHQVSVDEWVLVSCRFFSPVNSVYSTDAPIVAPMWLMATITLSTLLLSASF